MCTPKAIRAVERAEIATEQAMAALNAAKGQPMTYDDWKTADDTVLDGGLECEYCCEAVDTECDPHAICTDPWGGNMQVICESCRERAYDAHQQSLMENGPGPSLRDQQIEAMRFK